MSDRAAAQTQVCTSNTHATDKDTFVAISHIAIGNPIDNLSIEMKGVINVEPRNETPDWMDDCIHPREHLKLAKEMLSLLGFKEQEESIVENVFKEHIKRADDSGQRFKTVPNTEEALVAFTEGLSSMSTLRFPEFNYNGTYFQQPPSDVNNVIHTPVAERQTRSRTKQTKKIVQPVNEPHPPPSQQPEGTVSRVISFLTGTPSEVAPSRVLETQKSRSKSRSSSKGSAHSVESLTDGEKCNVVHRPLRNIIKISLIAECHHPLDVNDDNFKAYSSDSNDRMKIMEYLVPVNPLAEPGTSLLMREIRIVNPKKPQPNDIVDSVAELHIKDCSYNSIIANLASRIKMHSVIYCPAGGGKSELCHRLKLLGLEILDSEKCFSWRAVKRGKYLDCSNKTIVTDNLIFALNCRNTLYVLPCKTIYERRARYKKKKLPSYDNLKKFIKKQCKRPGHNLLETDLLLTSLPLSITYCAPSRFNVKRLSDNIADLEWQWGDIEIESYVE